MNTLKKLLPVILFFTCVVAFAGQNIPAPLRMVKQTSRDLIAALRMQKAASGARIQLRSVESIVRDNLLPLIDVDEMSSAVLGRYVRQAKKQQATFNKFKKQFVKLVISTYAAPLSNFNSDKVQFKPLRKFSSAQDTVRVKSRIVRSNGQKIPVTYYLSRQGKQWRIYDFSVDGISMVESYRSQFAHILAHQGFVGLVNKLSKKQA